MIDQVKLLFLFCILFIWNCKPKEAKIRSNSPNVILIMTDDQGYGDLARHGNPYIKTPNLDELYTQSVRLTNFHSGTTCSPTRAGLMTGRNCNRTGVWHTIAGRSQLDVNEMTMADVFTHNGYQTGMFGKWHLGDSYPFRPHDRGFQDAFYHGGGGVWQGPDYWDNDYFDDSYFRNGIPEKVTGYCTDVWFDEAMEFIENNKDKPFFTYIATNAPHGPFHVDSSYIRPYLGNDQINPNFNGMITNFDDNLGRLLSKLDQLNLSDNTILVYMTDNGTAAGVRLDKDQYREMGYNAGMRGKKASQYEGGHRVPCFIRWPKSSIQVKTDIDILTSHVDLLPTFVDLLNFRIPHEVKWDGVSLSELLYSDKVDAKWDYRVVITDTQRAELPAKWKKSAVMMANWRLINGEELFDLTDDPEQKKDISADNKEMVERLRNAYEQWWSDLEPGFAKYTRAEIGPSNGETVVLYSHDWHEAENNFGQPNLGGEKSHFTPWNHTHIRQGILVNGYWTVDVSQSGKYNIELRRWPREIDVPITKGIPSKPSVDGGNSLPEGKALAVNTASIQVGEKVMVSKIEENASEVDFIIEINEGPTTLKATFEGEGDLRLGAYYVYVTKM